MLPQTLYLTWHGIGTPPPGTPDDVARYWNPVEVFEDTLMHAPVVQAHRGVKVHMTFDDGNDTDFSPVFDLLQKHGITGIFFVCAGRIDKPDFLSASQLRAMHGHGMTIGSHGYDHIDWREATETTLRYEFIDARHRIEDAIGAEIETASVPFGLVDRRSAQWAVRAGFKRLFTSSGGFATADQGLIPRNSVVNGFDPLIDLDRLTSLGPRARSAWRDPVRRWRYWAGADRAAARSDRMVRVVSAE
jgi:peptidoglycan/xylan/chitin deacetylase (PgdA/CDA1 family)